MNKQFYSHLIEVETLTVELDNLDLSESQKKHLADLIDANVHNTVLDAILSELSEQDKKVFIDHLLQDDHSKIWQFLNSKVDHIEDKIKDVAKQLKEELRKDIREAKKK